MAFESIKFPRLKKESLSQRIFDASFALLDTGKGVVLERVGSLGVIESHRMSDIASFELTKTNDELAINTAPFARFCIRLILKSGGRVSFAIDGDRLAPLMSQYKDLSKKYEMPPVVECEYTLPPFLVDYKDIFK